MNTNMDMDIHPNDPQTVAEATGHFIGRDLLTGLLNATEDGPHPVRLISDALEALYASQTDDELRKLACAGMSTALYYVLLKGLIAIREKAE
jgi:hypothetical protein